MDRIRYEERETSYSFDEKRSISAKSNDCCCHCGKYAWWGYGATVDHFIPLYKGGTNRFINLVMLCKDCNREKDDKVVDIGYLGYLKDEYKKQLYNYQQAYIKSLDYVGRNRIFALDEYSIPVANQASFNNYRKGKSNKIKGQVYVFKKATMNDFKKLVDYYTKYLKKHDSYGGEENVMTNIMIWLKFGCIYYLEKNGEVAIMLPCTVKYIKNDWKYANKEIRGKHGEYYDDMSYVLNMYVFTYYSTDLMKTLSMHIVPHMVNYLLKEQGLVSIPVDINVLNDDKMKYAILVDKYGAPYNTANSLNGYPFEFSRVLYASDIDKQVEKTVDFFNNFKEEIEAIKGYFEDMPLYLRRNCEWMLYDFFSPKTIDDYDLLVDEDYKESNKKMLKDLRIKKIKENYNEQIKELSDRGL